MVPLTPRQREILSFLQAHHEEEGYWPSIREIQARFRFRSTNAVVGHLRALERKEAIARVAGQARAYRPVAAGNKPDASPGDEVVELPVFGAIAAGFPDMIESGDAVERLQVDLTTVARSGRRRTFALRVRGDSMVDAGIHDGDTVVVDPRAPRDGEIVVALIDGQSTLKRFVKPADDIPFLRSENQAFPALHPIAELVVQGVATALVRRL